MDVGLGAVAGPGGLGDGIRHGVEHDLLVDHLLARDRIGDLQEFKPVGADSHRGRSFFGFVVVEAARFARRLRAGLRSSSSSSSARSARCPRRSDSRIRSSVRTRCASPRSVSGSAGDGLEALLHVRQLDHEHPVLDAPEETPEALAALHRHGHLDLRLVAGPALEVAGAHERPVDPRRGDFQVVGRWRSGSSRSSTGEIARLTVSQSVTDMVPSGRSAMICTVQPFVPVTRTRTRLKPRSSITGSTMAATRAATPVSVISRLSRSFVMALRTLRGPSNKKERTPGGPLSTSSLTLQPELTAQIYRFKAKKARVLRKARPHRPSGASLGAENRVHFSAPNRTEKKHRMDPKSAIHFRIRCFRDQIRTKVR